MKLEVHSHVEGTNSVINFFTPIVKDTQLISGITLIGLLISISFFIREDHGKLTSEGLRVRTLARFAAAVWAMSTLGSIFLELANILSVPLVNTFDHLVLRSFLFQTALGNSLFINFVSAISVSLLLIFVRKNSGALLLLDRKSTRLNSSHT